jgi:hypothetical protein
MEALWKSLKLNKKVRHSSNPFLNQTSSNHEITNDNPKLHDLPSHLVKKIGFRNKKTKAEVKQSLNHMLS